MPPANRPPSCGAASIEAPTFRLPSSLLLLALLPGTGGARPLGIAGAPLPKPGTGGAPPIGGPPPPPEGFPTIGADRSFVTAFLSALPFAMSPSRAPRPPPAAGGREGRPPGGGGGGGGPPIPGMGGGGGGGGGGIVEGIFGLSQRVNVVYLASNGAIRGMCRVTGVLVTMRVECTHKKVIQQSCTEYDLLNDVKEVVKK